MIQYEHYDIAKSNNAMKNVLLMKFSLWGAHPGNIKKNRLFSVIKVNYNMEAIIKATLS